MPYEPISERLLLQPPASPSAIAREEREYGGHLPEDYLQFVRVSNGARTDGNLSILGVEGVVQRNEDYEVRQYMPGFFMIGDDGGGTAIVLDLRDGRIYEVEMGIMDEESMRFSAGSLAELLALGASLIEREDAAGRS